MNICQASFVARILAVCLTRAKVLKIWIDFELPSIFLAVDDKTTNMMNIKELILWGAHQQKKPRWGRAREGLPERKKDGIVPLSVNIGILSPNRYKITISTTILGYETIKVRKAGKPVAKRLVRGVPVCKTKSQAGTSKSRARQTLL